MDRELVHRKVVSVIVLRAWCVASRFSSGRDPQGLEQDQGRVRVRRLTVRASSAAVRIQPARHVEDSRLVLVWELGRERHHRLRERVDRRAGLARQRVVQASRLFRGKKKGR
jgi:hypothetical protein